LKDKILWINLIYIYISISEPTCRYTRTENLASTSILLLALCFHFLKTTKTIVFFSFLVFKHLDLMEYTPAWYLKGLLVVVWFHSTICFEFVSFDELDDIACLENIYLRIQIVDKEEYAISHTELLRRRNKFNRQEKLDFDNQTSVPFAQKPWAKSSHIWASRPTYECAYGQLSCPQAPLIKYEHVGTLPGVSSCEYGQFEFLQRPFRNLEEKRTINLTKIRENRNVLRANGNSRSIMNEWTFIASVTFTESIEIDAVFLFSQWSYFLLRISKTISTVAYLNTSLFQ